MQMPDEDEEAHDFEEEEDFDENVGEGEDFDGEI